MKLPPPPSALDAAAFPKDQLNAEQHINLCLLPDQELERIVEDNTHGIIFKKNNKGMQL